jgi:hypothetical protein
MRRVTKQAIVWKLISRQEQQARPSNPAPDMKLRSRVHTLIEPLAFELDGLAFVRRERSFANPLRSILDLFSAVASGGESPHVLGELFSAITHQNVADRKPPALYLFSRLKQFCLASLDPQIALRQLPRHRFGSSAGVTAINVVALPRSSFLTHTAVCGVGDDALRTQVSREFSPPFAQRCPADV